MLTSKVAVTYSTSRTTKFLNSKNHKKYSTSRIAENVLINKMNSCSFRLNEN